MQDLEKLLQAAEELKETTVNLEEELLQANSRAKEEAEILSYSSYSDGFHVTEKKFLEITNGDIFTISERDSEYYKYEYQYFINGIMFYCISNKFWEFDEREKSCLGCLRFEPKGGNYGYCEVQDHVVSVNGGCDEREVVLC